MPWSSNSKEIESLTSIIVLLLYFSLFFISLINSGSWWRAYGILYIFSFKNGEVGISGNIAHLFMIGRALSLLGSRTRPVLRTWNHCASTLVNFWSTFMRKQRSEANNDTVTVPKHRHFLWESLMEEGDTFHIQQSLSTTRDYKITALWTQIEQSAFHHVGRNNHRISKLCHAV